MKGQGSAKWVQYFGCVISQDFSGFSRLTTCRYTWIRSDGESGCSTCAFRCPKHWRGNARIAGAKTATALCVSTIPSHALSVNLKPGAHKLSQPRAQEAGLVYVFGRWAHVTPHHCQSHKQPHHPHPLEKRSPDVQVCEPVAKDARTSPSRGGAWKVRVLIAPTWGS